AAVAGDAVQEDEGLPVAGVVEGEVRFSHAGSLGPTAARPGADPSAGPASVGEPGGSGVAGIDAVGVELVAADGVGHRLGLDLAGGGEGGQRGHDDVLGVDFEVASQRLAGVAATEAVG